MRNKNCDKYSKKNYHSINFVISEYRARKFQEKLYVDEDYELHPHSVGVTLFKMKCLHQREAQEFKWSIRDDIDIVHRSTNFFGPI